MVSELLFRLSVPPTGLRTGSLSQERAALRACLSRRGIRESSPGPPQMTAGPYADFTVLSDLPGPYAASRDLPTCGDPSSFIIGPRVLILETPLVQVLPAMSFNPNQYYLPPNLAVPNGAGQLAPQPQGGPQPFIPQQPQPPQPQQYGFPGMPPPPPHQAQQQQQAGVGVPQRKSTPQQQPMPFPNFAAAPPYMPQQPQPGIPPPPQQQQQQQQQQAAAPQGQLNMAAVEQLLRSGQLVRNLAPGSFRRGETDSLCPE